MVCTTFQNSCGVIPDRLPKPELFTNGIAEGNECWQIASTDADSLVIFLEPEGRSSDKRIWFSLATEPQSSTSPSTTATSGATGRVVPIATAAPAPIATPTPDEVSSPADLVDRVMDGVVRVEAGFSSGSGFIFDVEGTTAFAATNRHVIDNTDAVDVTVSNTRTYEALVVGWDAERDVAVLAIC